MELLVLHVIHHEYLGIYVRISALSCGVLFMVEFVLVLGNDYYNILMIMI